MTSLRDQIDEIKSKIKLSDELSKHIQISMRGNDPWCLCFFHNEKTPSMKINDDLSSYYCFGCGAKGDVISFYTDYLNYSFNDAVKELGGKVGININLKRNFLNKDEENKSKKIFNIYEDACNWYSSNIFLKENITILEYLKKRKISHDTIKSFKIGYSSNKQISLFDFLINKSYSEFDLLQTNLFKRNKNNKLRDFFYKRLMFPITNNSSKVIGFGGRSIANMEPKYINSSESGFFKKRNILYNLDNAKKIARKKNNLLICEGYMDVISLADKGINSVVAPLGTSMTNDQLLLAWKICKIPTIMFDGDLAGKKASIKSALLALKYIKPGFSLQFLEIPKDEDPDSLINKLSKNEFIKFLKNPKDLSTFVFDYAKNSFKHKTPDQKIIFDKYFDDITNLIEDKKVRFFYKREFKNKLFNFFKVKNNNNPNLIDSEKLNNKIKNLKEKEYLSFIASYINHPSIRMDVIEDFTRISYDNSDLLGCFSEISKNDKIKLSKEDLIASISNQKIQSIISKSLNTEIYKLFPYSSALFNSRDALSEIKKSIKIIDTRLSNFIELDKSIKDLESEATLLKWNEFKKLSYDYISELE